MATQAGLLGRWRIVRRIADDLGPDALFLGDGVFSPAGDSLIWREEGALQIGEGPQMTATRAYIWRFDRDRVFVDYADGAPFHHFSPRKPYAVHLCGPDRYEVSYHFAPPNYWSAAWRVTGPSKDYRMVSDMTRL